jgi:hypothetical protein
MSRAFGWASSTCAFADEAIEDFSGSALWRSGPLLRPFDRRRTINTAPSTYFVSHPLQTPCRHGTEPLPTA